MCRPGASLPPTWRGLALALADAGMSASRLVKNARQVQWVLEEAAAREAAEARKLAAAREMAVEFFVCKVGSPLLWEADLSELLGEDR